MGFPWPVPPFPQDSALLHSNGSFYTLQKSAGKFCQEAIKGGQEGCPVGIFGVLVCSILGGTPCCCYVPQEGSRPSHLSLMDILCSQVCVLVGVAFAPLSKERGEASSHFMDLTRGSGLHLHPGRVSRRTGPQGRPHRGQKGRNDCDSYNTMAVFGVLPRAVRRPGTGRHGGPRDQRLSSREPGLGQWQRLRGLREWTLCVREETQIAAERRHVCLFPPAAASLQLGPTPANKRREPAGGASRGREGAEERERL